jgi:5-methyltetrahydrofolate--homocysteine methyltransferase
LGAQQIIPFVQRLVASIERLMHVCLNAGVPNVIGGYDAAEMAKYNEEFFQNKWLNMVGGCCGSTPAHIAALKGMIDEKPHKPRDLPPRRRPKMWMSGLGLASRVRSCSGS